MKFKSSCIILLSINSLSTNAEVTLDGTLGRGGALKGPDYLIGADLGRHQGGNLFHSFQGFNLQSHESATFSGPNSISNIISRVTGGNPSQIDGLIRSTIPNADMYFLNPYGIMFGENAKLDVQGSFHASTADYLRLGEGGRFDARYPNESLLTIAPIEAFGFLTDTPAPITTQNSDLSVSDGNSLSLIGGNLRLNGNSPIMFDEKGFMAVFARSKLSASAGRINLASVASIGEVIPSEFGLDLNAEGGTITANNILMDVSGRGSGSVFIRGGQLFMNDAVIQANTMADQNGKDINLKLTDSVNMKGDLIAMSKKTFGNGNAGNILIMTPLLEVTGSFIDASTLDIGRAGNINIETTQMILKGGAEFSTSTLSSGQGGKLEIKAKKSLSLSGQRQGVFLVNGVSYTDYPSAIASSTFGSGKSGTIIVTTGHLNLINGLIAESSMGIGDVGDIIINADSVNLTEGGFIATNSLIAGQAGNIKMTVSDTLSLSGSRTGWYHVPGDILKVKDNQTSIQILLWGKAQASQSGLFISADTIISENEGSITTSTFGDNAGSNVSVEVNHLYLNSGGQINSSNAAFAGDIVRVGKGNSGTIQIVTRDDIVVSGRSERGLPSGLFTNTGSSGQGGNLEVQTDHLRLSEGGEIAAKSLDIGHAGTISVQANSIHITNNGNISTSAEHAMGGNITITTPNLLYLRGGRIETSVHGGKGDGGNINIANPIFVVLNNSEIHAHAEEGHGGNITISSNHFISSNNSSIDASSKLGIDGEVKIDSPVVDLSGALLVLSSGFDVDESFDEPCKAAQAGNSFVVKPISGVPPIPSDWKANLLILLPVSDKKIPLTIIDKGKTAGQSPEKVALLTGCQPETKHRGGKKSRVISEPPLF
jgi:filamentous hemagglutinin family protein